MSYLEATTEQCLVIRELHLSVLEVSKAEACEKYFIGVAYGTD